MEEDGPARATRQTHLHRPRRPMLLALVLPSRSLAGCRRDGRPDSLARIRASGKIVYGTDAEGGGPYAYPDPDRARQDDRLRGRADRACSAAHSAEPG